jgi:hypothetical protein
VDFVSDINVSGGGPLIARKLRMFTSFRDWRVHVNVPAAFSTLVLDKTDITSGLINLNYQVTDKNRLTGFYSRQYYKKPNRFLAASNLLVEGVHEQRRRRLRRVPAAVELGAQFEPVRRRALRVEQDLVPDLSERQRSDAARHRHGIRTRNFTADTERFRDRYQANATFQYYVDQALGGRHEFKFGFDHAHAPVEVRTRRFDDVELTYNSGTGRSQNVTLFAHAVLSQDRRGRHGALRAGHATR